MGTRSSCVGLMCVVYKSELGQHVDGLTWQDSIGDLPFQTLRTQCKDRAHFKGCGFESCLNARRVPVTLQP
eukprot:5185923-Amphidinium_carterae.1